MPPHPHSKKTIQLGTSNADGLSRNQAGLVCSPDRCSVMHNQCTAVYWIFACDTKTGETDITVAMRSRHSHYQAALGLLARLWPQPAPVAASEGAPHQAVGKTTRIPRQASATSSCHTILLLPVIPPPFTPHMHAGPRLPSYQPTSASCSTCLWLTSQNWEGV